MNNTASFTTIVLFTLLCLVAPLSSAYAEIQEVATVVALRGTVVAQRKSGAGRNLSLKSQIFQEDVLKTDKNGQLQIMFTDSSIISLGRDSEVKIAEYRWQPEQKDGALKTQVKEGSFRVMGGALAKDAPQNFKTETPTATIGIRGSMYAFKSTADSLSVVFQGGKGIEIFNDQGKVTITTPGFGTHVVLNAPPAHPTKFTEHEINNLNRGLNGNDSNGSGGSSGTGWGGMKSGAAAPAPYSMSTEQGQGLNGNGSGGSSGAGWEGAKSGAAAPAPLSMSTEQGQGLNSNGSGGSSGARWGGANSGAAAPSADINVAPKPPVSPVLPPVNMLPPSTPNLTPLPAPNTYRRNY